MKAAFWISLAVIGYTYAGYPLIMFLLARLKPRMWKARAGRCFGQRGDGRT